MSRLPEYFHFAEVAYQTNNSPFAPSISGYGAAEVRNFKAKSPSFAAQLYVKPGATEPEAFRITFRGSNDPGDFMIDDTAFARGEWSTQMSDAIRFVGDAILDIKSQYSQLTFNEIRARLDVTGHSLGGGLAELVAKFYGIPGLSIDGPGAWDQTVSAEFAALKAEYRSKGLTELQDDYTLDDGAFEARRYTVVGTAGRHLDEAAVVTSPELEAYLQAVRDTPAAIYAFDMGGRPLRKWPTASAPSAVTIYARRWPRQSTQLGSGPLLNH